MLATRRHLKAFALIAVATAAAACRPAAAEPGRLPARMTDIVLARDSEVLRGLVPPRTTLASMFEAHALLTEDAIALVRTLAQKFDVRRVRAGQPYRIDRFPDGRVREFEYEIDLERRIVARRREAPAALFETDIVPIPRQIDRVIVHGAITESAPSLVQALETAGERVELSLALADIFSGELDFNSDLQPGDTFRLIVERATREGGLFAGYGPVLAAEYVNAGRMLQAVRFTPPEGKPGYYDADGRSLKRFFLKSPLKFEPRVTSSFSRARRHPVLDYTRAHNGVDYAALPGAPVTSVALGVVTFAGWTTGGGYTVTVRHASGYESEYLHLSTVAVRRGDRVGQGELIGRVGSSGLATGPHLHYGLRRNGRYLNPLREHQNMPPGEPVDALSRASFDAERDRLFQFLSETRVVDAR